MKKKKSLTLQINYSEKVMKTNVRNTFGKV